ncbi:hypothetical protein [Helicobacter trogontum]|uniref:Glycoside hydrolase family 19 catalytic domain-containing protein n=1 Tax=Helicobacter trogontum TaxID=50960 RepID=A0A4U8T9J4_9HELI|nr:hypothetical protein [Helicobacter trogontum]MDY5184948.1 hypothetical protein [Helicobacter trogontum]TLD96449.1 hypothetical protein LS80_008405 [Helicobacter trogontum]
MLQAQRNQYNEVNTKVQKLKDMVNELNRLHTDNEPMFVHYKLDTIKRVNFFFAQVLAETGNLLLLREILSDETNVSYEGGANYRGRGIIHITHERTYRAFTAYAQEFGVSDDFVLNPELVATNGRYAIIAGGFFWTWQQKRYALKTTSPYYHLFNEKFRGLFLWEIEGVENATDNEKMKLSRDLLMVGEQTIKQSPID